MNGATSTTLFDRWYYGPLAVLPHRERTLASRNIYKGKPVDGAAMPLAISYARSRLKWFKASTFVGSALICMGNYAHSIANLSPHSIEARTLGSMAISTISTKLGRRTLDGHAPFPRCKLGIDKDADKRVTA